MSKKQEKKESKLQKRERVAGFYIISGILAVLSSVILWICNSGLQSSKAFSISSNIIIYGVALLLFSILGLVVTFIMKNKYYIIWSIQVLICSLSMILLKYFSIDSSIRIMNRGVAGFFYLIVQVALWAYVVYLVVRSNLKK